VNSAASSCAAAPPAGAAELIPALAVPAGRRIAYREEVRHPALVEPEVATGTMHVAENGAFVREQTTPERQISEVGDRMLSIRSSPQAEPTLYPIPGEVRPMLLALRRMLAGDGAAILADYTAELSTRAPGWVLSLRPHGAVRDAALTFSGCGDRLQSLEITGGDGVVRSIDFSPWR
jgi:hypothetical protein